MFSGDRRISNAEDMETDTTHAGIEGWAIKNVKIFVSESMSMCKAIQVFNALK